MTTTKIRGKTESVYVWVQYLSVHVFLIRPIFIVSNFVMLVYFTEINCVLCLRDYGGFHFCLLVSVASDVFNNIVY